jgi:hypothetical protein
MPDIGVSKDALRAVVGLTGQFVGTTDAATLESKTIVLADNILKQTTPALGSIPKDNGTKFVPLARGAANLPLHSNSGGTDIEYSKLEVAGGGTGATTLTGIVKASGTSAFTAVAAPTGAILGDSDVQNISGAKTFASTTLAYRNPANTFTLTQVNPAIGANLNTEFECPYAYVIYKTGTTIKRMNMVTRAIESSGTTADVVIQAAIDALGTFSGKRIYIKPGVYSITASLNFTAGNGYCFIEGEDRLGTLLRPSGDFPVFDINGKTFVNFQDIGFAHTQSGYTSSLVQLRNAAIVINFFRCLWDGGGFKVGNAVGLDATSGSVYRNRFVNCQFNDFENSIFANLPGSTFFINNNRFLGCEFNVPKRVLKITGVASSIFDDNEFTDCELQSYAGTLCGWDYETGNSGHAFYSVHNNCMAQDLPVGVNYALLNTGTNLTMTGCYPSWKIGGAGALTTKVRIYDIYSHTRGTSTQSGNASTKVFNIAHTLLAAPTNVRITPATADALGTPVVTSDSTNIILTYPTAPPSGTNNLSWNWEATVF